MTRNEPDKTFTCQSDTFTCTDGKRDSIDSLIMRYISEPKKEQ